MPHVITEACIGEVRGTCFDVCPADCINYVAHMPAGYPGEGRPMAVINPDECIDCSACLVECPVKAITDRDDEAPYWAQINERLAPVFAGQRPPRR